MLKIDRNDNITGHSLWMQFVLLCKVVFENYANLEVQ